MATAVNLVNVQMQPLDWPHSHLCGHCRQPAQLRMTRLGEVDEALYCCNECLHILMDGVPIHGLIDIRDEVSEWR